MSEKVSTDLAKQFEEKYQGDMIPKTKPQRDISQQQRLNIIQAMLAKSELMIGVGPISMEHIKRMERLLPEKGVLKHLKTQKSDYKEL